ncbi:hypothetical protein GCM10027021_41040 [Dyella kyungheensis]
MAYASKQEPRSQRVSKPGTSGRNGCKQEAAKDGKPFNAIGMRAREPLQERREVGVVRPEFIGFGASGENKIGANDLHEHE